MPDIETAIGNTEDEPCFKVMLLRDLYSLCQPDLPCRHVPPRAEGRTHKEFVSPIMGTVWPMALIPKLVDRDWVPGEWTGAVEDPRLCGRGWHLWRLGPAYELALRDRDTMWSLGHRHVLFRAEGRGAYINGAKKRVYQQIRLVAPMNKRTMEPMNRRPVWWMA